MMVLTIKAATHQDDDPKTYREAIDSPQSEKWIDAMKEQLASIQKTKVWKESALPEGRKSIGSTWGFRTKRNEAGEIYRYKARIVAQRFSQVPGLDYDETYAPVSRLTSLRVFLTIATVEDLVVHQLDIQTAFLNGLIDRELYLRVLAQLRPTGRHEGLFATVQRSIWTLTVRAIMVGAIRHSQWLS